MILINGEVFNSEEFHNGEVIFKKTSVVNPDRNVIEMKFKDNRDITNLLFARQWLTDVALGAECDLVMAYCPYERMDRPINDQLFSMKYFAEILSKFDFDRVYILDPHSEVCVDKLGDAGIKVMNMNLMYYIKQVVDEFQPDYICYPDKGAYSKYPKVLDGLNLESFYGQKTRDLSNNGTITNYELVNAPNLTDKKVLIIDDICCLGGTAYNAALKMKDAGAKEVAFYISHCENGIFVGNVLKPETVYEHREEELEMYDLEGHKTGEKRIIELNIPINERLIIDKVYTADTMLLKEAHPMITIVK